ncbi:hypothetical protein GCM10010287_55160 [Streptomyces variabilis]|uniref:Uncharacterized protein n=1 Tax=Streptomyces variabilis TaxID=67372 RepID=A0ABQ2U573_9ACTN|nr:hypothetical protein GCM10010265_59740 [Streptomyces griseoincarnatus]GGT73683.1 hypothetical protein GCM10010287_55160 [Streptomyces variabilis]
MSNMPPFPLRRRCHTGADQAVAFLLVELGDLAVQRPYRCKDREYVRVARAVDGETGPAGRDACQICGA